MKIFHKFIITFILLPIIITYPQSDSLIISEVMFSPSASNSEFIEIFNLSYQNSIDLSKFQIIYYTANADTIVETGDGIILPPRSFALLLEGDYDLASGIYSAMVPDSSIKLKIQDNAFGSSGMANTEDRTVRVISSFGDTVDVYSYSAKNVAGISDEKIILNTDSSSINWANSLTLNGTPGKGNSVSPKKYDLSVTDLFYTPTEIFEGDEVNFTSIIKNIGTSTCENFIAYIFIDINKDSTAQQNEIIATQNISALEPNDSTELTGQLDSLLAGNFDLFTIVNCNTDEQLQNNIYSIIINIYSKLNSYNDIIISEIMFAPTDNEPEWLELYNRSDFAINLSNWRIADKVSSPIIYDSTLFIQPHEFLVLTDDESIHDFYSIQSSVQIINLPSLNNTGDNLKLLDSLERGIDSVNYTSGWGGQDGYSLEKINLDGNSNNSTNWGSSVSNLGGTPGKVNSITPKEYDLTINHFFTENDFVIVGESIQLNVTVGNIGTKTSGNYTLKIFHDTNSDSIVQENEFIYQYSESGLSPNDSAELSLELTDYNPGLNYYIVKIIYDEDENVENNISYLNFIGIEINEVRNDLIINEIMYAPNDPEPEWIELFNRSDKIINLKNYQIVDEVDTTKVIKDNLMIQPFQYIVLAKDLSFLSVYSDTINFVISAFPILNNAGDKLIILDSLNRVIDSLAFNSGWGGQSGVSLERIDSELSSIESTNWSSAKLGWGGTPGIINSISQRDYDIEISQLNFEPHFPIFNENVRIRANLKNIGKNNLTCSLRLSEDVDLDSTNYRLLESIELLEIYAGDSISIDFDYVIDSIKGMRGFLAEVYSDSDQDTSNNKLYKAISPGYSSNILIISEIMYSPINGEPEWIELFNTTDKEVNLRNWVVSDIYATPKVTKITDLNLLIQANEYFVIAKDSTIWDYHKNISSSILISNFANLNNDIDGVVLKDQYGNLIDSVEYKYSWGGVSGYSLERKSYNPASDDSTNWNSSIDLELSTPGRQNSITQKNYDLKLVSITTSPEYPTIFEDVFVNTVVHNIGVNVLNDFSVIIEISKNGKLSELELFNNLSLGSGDSLTLKTKNSFILDDSTKIISKITSELDNDSTNNTYSIMIYPSFLKNSIIINEFMASPNTEEAEWIELYNNSSNLINISNWSISDLISSPTKSIITENDIIINSGEFFIITSDTSKHLGISDTKIIEANFGTLGNYDDGILLYDFNNKLIDSLLYDKNWRIEKGRSLERVSFDDPSYERYNWLPSLSVTGSTPGSRNSILETQPYTRGNVKINEIMYDPDNNNSEFIELYNNTESSIDIGGWNLFDGSYNYFELSKTFFEIKPSEYFIFAADSLILEYYPELQYRSAIIISNTGDLSLSNDEETIMIADHWGNVIDSINYSSKWHNKNLNITKSKSLERINPNLDGNDNTNWSTSVDPIGATPIKKNSIYTEGEISESKLSFSPNPFSPDNDGFEDFTLINYNLSVNTAQIRIKIFDDKGRLVRTLVNNKPSSSHGTEIFDGLDESGNPLRIGMYIVFLEASNSISGVVDVLKDVIVIARKL